MMEVSTKAMKALRADSQNDRLAAEDFCQEALTEARQRALSIEQIRELRQILDHDAMRKATGALAGIRHIAAAIEGLAGVHDSTELGKIFRGAHEELSRISLAAADNHRWLWALFPAS
jgi:signal recognition particle GTPase